MTDLKHTPLYEEHLKLNGKMVDFGGWALPVNYGSQIEEHHAVRKHVGMFDVSHMTVSDIEGPDARAFLRHVLANNIEKTDATAGKAIYSCLLNEQGGVIDDLIAYHISATHYRIVSNAGTRDAVMAWLSKQIETFDATLTEQPQLALLALQGQDSARVCEAVFGSDSLDKIKQLSRFQGAFVGELFVGRTGYTGEDGYEFVATAENIVALWQSLSDQGVQACGLGARDTLRLEAGMALYGNDLDAEHTPLESGLAWTLNLNEDRDFVGKQAMIDQPARFKTLGLVLNDKGVLRAHQPLELNGVVIGELTSGTFSPTLERSIGMARIEAGVNSDQLDQLSVKMRDKNLSVTVVKPPFVKQGKPTF